MYVKDASFDLTPVSMHVEFSEHLLKASCSYSLSCQHWWKGSFTPMAIYSSCTDNFFLLMPVSKEFSDSEIIVDYKWGRPTWKSWNSWQEMLKASKERVKVLKSSFVSSFGKYLWLLFLTAQLLLKPAL